MANGGLQRTRARQLAIVCCLALVCVMLIAPASHAQEAASYRYPTAFFCGSDDAPTSQTSVVRRDTLLAVANHADDELTVEITLRGDQTVEVLRSISAGGRLVFECGDVPLDFGQIGFVDIISPTPVDVVAMYQTVITQLPTSTGATSEYAPYGEPVAGERVLASVTFHVQLERQLHDKVERAAVADLGFMVGKPVPLVVMTYTSTDTLLTPADNARHALWQRLAGRLIEFGMDGDKASDAAHRIIGDAMVMWVEVDDTDIALGDVEVSTDIVAISAVPKVGAISGSTPGPTPNPYEATPTAVPYQCTECSDPPVTEIGPISIELVDPPEARDAFGWLGLLTALLVGILATLLLGLLGWLLSRWLRRNDKPDPLPPPATYPPPVVIYPPNPPPPTVYPPPPNPPTPPPTPPGGSYLPPDPPKPPPDPPKPPPTPPGGGYPVPGDGLDPRYRMSCHLIGEREIDVDDRQADLAIVVEIEAARSIFERGEDAHLVVAFDFDGQQIAFNGEDRGEITFALPDLVPGQPVTNTVTVSTGVFSNDTLKRESAEPGRYGFTGTVSSTPVPRDYCASVPVVQSSELHFFVAAD